MSVIEVKSSDPHCNDGCLQLTDMLFSICIIYDQLYTQWWQRNVKDMGLDIPE